MVASVYCATIYLIFFHFTLQPNFCNCVIPSSSSKGGSCPIFTPEELSSDCKVECDVDAHCQALYKCCANGCGKRCYQAVSQLDQVGVGDGELRELLENLLLQKSQTDNTQEEISEEQPVVEDVREGLEVPAVKKGVAAKSDAATVDKGDDSKRPVFSDAARGQKETVGYDDESKIAAGPVAHPWVQESVEGESIHEDDTKPLSSVLFHLIVAACCIAAIAGLAAAGYFWHRLHKTAKAATDTEYPAYGVTGPAGAGGGSPKEQRSGSASDRKLAQSAQMYHYQHQKQQMIAMEKASAGETKDGDNSPCESEEEDGGDYTVYECPGLASTGEMTVKNPLFTEETPTTGTSSIVTSTASTDPPSQAEQKPTPGGGEKRETTPSGKKK